jgi:2-polyprenyl-6-methoxyphenol hydroxylase-like FAD-dependent oxidoreductase
MLSRTKFLDKNATVVLAEWSQTWGNGQSVGLTQLVDGRVYWFATAAIAEGTQFNDDRGEAIRRFGHWHTPIGDIIDATDSGAVLRHDIYALPRPLPRFHHGQVALLGDAAHAMTPHLGQGACLALEDAVTLAAELADQPRDIRASLISYDAKRRPRAQQLSKLSDHDGSPIDITNPVATTLRNMLIRSIPRRVAIAHVARPATWTAPPIRTAALDPRDRGP